MLRTYSDMSQFTTFEDRFEYLRLKGAVGEATFGFERWVNQGFYTSKQWKDIRNHVISRDSGLDLGVDGFEIYDKIIVHHMNPMTPEAIEEANADILNPEYLICTTHQTHNAIHYGNQSLLTQKSVERSRGDTKMW